MSDILASGREAESLISPAELEALSSIERRVLWLATQDRRLCEPRAAKGRRAQGRRPPGFVGLDGLAHDRALLLRSACGGPRIGQAARLARAARGRIPARTPGAPLPDDAARLRRPSVVPQPHEGPLPGRLLDRLGRARLGGAPVWRAREPLRRDALRARHRRALHLGARRRRARRGKRLGGGRSSRRRAGSANVLWIVDLNRQSLDRVVPVIKRASSSRTSSRAAGWQVLELKYGRRLREAYRQRRRRAPAPADRRDAERAVPESLRRLRGGRLRRAPARARRRRSARGSRACSPTYDGRGSAR